jgi:signal peptidase
MKTVKRVLSTAVNVISTLIIIVAVVMLITVIMTRSSGVPNFMGYSVFRVMTGSMEPTLKINTLIVVKRTDISEIKMGDIITLYSEDPALKGQINTHRVVRAETEDGEKVLYTRGDANLIDDKYPTRQKDLIGRMVFSSFLLGTIVRLAANPVVFIPVIIVPLVVMLVINIMRSVKITKSMMAEEEEKAIAEARAAVLKKEEERMAHENGKAENADGQTAAEDKKEDKEA